MPYRDVFSTGEAARQLGVRPNYLQRAIFDGRLRAPAKGPGDAYQWTRRDIERASWALLHRPFDTGGEHSANGGPSDVW